MKNSTLYFAITSEEKQNLKDIYYPRTHRYSYKGIHKSLDSLREFIRKEFNNKDDWFYIVLNMNEVNIAKGVISDEDNMVVVNLPLRINLKNRIIKPLF